MGATIHGRAPAAGAVLAMLLAAVAAWSPASGLGVTPASAAQIEPVARCDRIGAIETSVLSELDARLATFRARRGAVLASQAERWADQDERLDAELAALRRRLADRLGALDPATEAQREAIAVFRAAVATALEARQMTIGTAIREYRSGVLRAMEALFTETLKLFAAHREVLRAQFARAYAACASGASPSTVIDALQASLAATRADLAAALAALPSLTQLVAPLETALRGTLAEAHAAFREALEAAAAALQAAFRAG